VRFEIWDSTDTNRLAFGDTGDIFETANLNWQEFGLVFQTLAGQSTVILKMRNNGQGGCGNDLAIDDIEFKSCGDTVAVTDSNNNSAITLCSAQVPFISTLTATPDFSVYNTHFYQWQESTDNGVTWTDIIGQTNQTLLISASNTTYYRTKVAEVAINLSNLQCVSFSDEYQLTINQLPPIPTLACWETASINNSACSWEITGTQPTQPILECWETATFNTTTCLWDVTGTQPVQPSLNCWESAIFNNSTCLWEVSGTQPVQPSLECWQTTSFNTSSCSWDVFGAQPTIPTGLQCWEIVTFNSATCLWEISGTQPMQPTLNCWETTVFNSVTCSWETIGNQPTQPNLECWETTVFNNTTCSWEVSGSQPIQPILECWQTTSFNTITCSWDIFGTQPGNIIEENLELCEGTTLTLQAQTSISNPTYIWTTGDTTDEITIDTAGAFSVEITDAVCNFETKIFNITLIETPIIESVITDGNDIIVSTLNTGDFEYSLDGNIFQSNNIFYDIAGGLYNVSVKQQNCNSTVITEHLHFYIPKFFTPNGDGINDRFSLSGIEFFNLSEVSVFNRHGKLLKFSRNSTFSWDGTYRGKELPSDDYWYVIIIDGQKLSGHFTLKR